MKPGALRLMWYLGIGAIALALAVPGVAGAAEKGRKDDHPLAHLQATPDDAMADARGRFDVSNNTNTSISNLSLGDVSAGAFVSAGPMNVISADSFGNFQGIATVVQNAANNVLIHTTTEMTVNFLP